MKIRKLHIDNFKLFQNFTLDFASSKTQNLIVICGINGSGKTTLFKDFIYHILIIFKNKIS
ncbi:MAG: AAA family ATPase [Desulfobacteraceae bacterium]|nr:AAA family ATPase [Desulfobacteraceae bacterium]MCP4347963.1 AAA family ATPase [Desulfobacterales bacterium]